MKAFDFYMNTLEKTSKNNNMVFKDILATIQKASDDGKLQVNLSKYNVTSEIRNELKSMGFSVRKNECYDELAPISYTVSWNVNESWLDKLPSELQIIIFTIFLIGGIQLFAFIVRYLIKSITM